jgi:hypothetical protein
MARGYMKIIFISSREEPVLAADPRLTTVPEIT